MPRLMEMAPVFCHILSPQRIIETHKIPQLEGTMTRKEFLCEWGHFSARLFEVEPVLS